ncbi:MAG TPA: DUF58 domain-containing protein [Thermomicrobiales bacterium]
MTGLRLAILILAALVFTQFNEWAVLDHLALTFSALLALAYAWSRSSLIGIRPGRRIETDRRQVGQTLIEELLVENRSLIGKLWLEVRDLSTLPGHDASHVIRLPGRGAVSWTVETVCARRGKYRTGPLIIRGGDPFGLFSVTRHYPVQLEVLVYPATVPLPHVSLPVGILSGGNVIDRRTPFVTPSVSTIREYVPGDPFNRISWSATARQGRLMVKEFEADPTSDVWIVLDLEQRWRVRATGPLPFAPDANGNWPVEAWLDSTEEYAVTVAASLARRCLEEGRAVGLIASGSHYHVLPAERSERQYLKLLETLAVAEADGQRPLVEVLMAEGRRFTRDCGVIVVTASTDGDWVSSLLTLAGRRVRSRAVVIDPSSFASVPSADTVVNQLLSVNIPVHCVRYGDTIATALANHAGTGVATGVLAWRR